MDASATAATSPRDVAVPVGHDTLYPTNLRAELEDMIPTVVTVSGSTPTITAVKNGQYKCGTLTSLSFTPSATGVCDVIFTSGTTPTVLTVPNTVKWPDWFDPTSLDASTTYELNVLDGVYGAVMTWATA